MAVCFFICRHEMQKEIEHRRKVKHIKDKDKKHEEEKKWEESQARHNKHEKIHTPVSCDFINNTCLFFFFQASMKRNKCDRQLGQGHQLSFRLVSACVS